MYLKWITYVQKDLIRDNASDDEETLVKNDAKMFKKKSFLCTRLALWCAGLCFKTDVGKISTLNGLYSS